MSKSRFITLAAFREKGAYLSQVELFEKFFGEQVEVTEELCVKRAGDFSWDWAADNFLSEPARDTYYAATDPAGDAYYAANRDAWNAYVEANAAAWYAYLAAIKPAMAAYSAAQARAFAQAFLSQTE